MRALAGVAMLLALPLCGCLPRTQPVEFFQLSPESPATRAMQCRFFETSDQKELLSASAAVLQDLGFQVEEIERETGFLRAAKERSAREHGQDIRRFLVAIITFCYVGTPVDLHQKISAVITARPVYADGTRQEVRVSFYRVVWMGGGWIERNTIKPGTQKMEVIRDPLIYQRFFAGLSKAVFLEGFTL